MGSRTIHIGINKIALQNDLSCLFNIDSISRGVRQDISVASVRTANHRVINIGKSTGIVILQIIFRLKIVAANAC